MIEPRVIRVGIVGLGRAGWGLHARTVDRLRDRFAVTAVTSRLASRRAEAQARFWCAVYDDPTALTTADDVDLVVVATPSHVRSEIVVPLLEGGKDVLVEKPFATSLAEGEEMLAAAERHGRLLTCSQNRRWSIDFLRLRELVDSGIVGSPVEIKISWHSFRRRWDWQTLRRYGGGALNNDGSHVVDQALLLCGNDDDPVDVHCRMTRTDLSAGDAEDHVKVVMSTRSGPIVDIEVSNACAYPQETWLVLGTTGGIAVADGRLRWKTVDRHSLPERTPHEPGLPDRSYGHEDLVWTEHSEEVPVEDYTESHARLYTHLHEVITGSADLEIEPGQIRRQLDVLDRCRASAPVVVVP